MDISRRIGKVKIAWLFLSQVKMITMSADLSIRSQLLLALERGLKKNFPAVVTILSYLHVDPLQFAYLKNRSTTDALLMVVEKVKQGLIADNKAEVVFFDFTNAFGRVDRQCLLYKLSKDFGITGKLFLHISSFLSDRIATVKVNGHYGDWILSMLCTSAGTNLGPLLFIMYMHAISDRIFPKFADDLVSVVVDSDMLLITKKLQQSVDDLVSWSRKWGMALNVSKTKVMLFGNVHDDELLLS